MYAQPSASSQQRGVATGSSHGYIKVKDIGSGSYGKATLVQDHEGKLYVMKTIDMSAMDKKQRRDAINEVRVLSCLKHPYIVSYRESFSENNTLAIVMDYADGGDLYQRISQTRKARQTFGERQILRWFTEGALALKYMHDKHVLHRDLKSQNLFLTSSDRLRVGDFGISKVLESTAAFARTAIGTPYYLSPEICQEKPYSFGSDIWALGCVVYEMAALRVPFDAQNIQALVQKITRGPLPQVPANYSQELRQLCGDLLHRDQAQRPTATDIIQRRYVQDEIRRMLMEEGAKEDWDRAKARAAEEDQKEREERDFWEEQARRKSRPNSYRRKDASEAAGSEKPRGRPRGEEAPPPPRKQKSRPQTREAYLDLLGFPKNADPTQEELKKAYRAMAMQWHPDRPHNRERAAEATETFQAAKEAYEYFMEGHRSAARR